jgi:hypothetical protein
MQQDFSLGANQPSSSSPQRAIPIERALAAYCRDRQIRFKVEGDPESSLRVLMPEAFLPVLALHAEASAIDLLQADTAPDAQQQLQQALLGHLGGSQEAKTADAPTASDGSSAAPSHRRLVLGTEIREDPQALFGVCATVPALTGDGAGSLRLVLFVHALHRVFGYTANRQVELKHIHTKYAAQDASGSVMAILGDISAAAKEARWSPHFPR